MLKPPRNPLPTTQTAIVAAPTFWLAVEATDDVVISIRFLTQAPTTPPKTPPQPQSTALLTQACAQLNQWLKNPATLFNLPLAATGTAFRQRVWAEIAAIPPGQTRTYGDIAQTLHSAPRAVGQACGDNPFPIIVPCHRVVSQTGLGGFNHSSGDDLGQIKRWLLAHEVRAKNPA